MGYPEVARLSDKVVWTRTGPDTSRQGCAIWQRQVCLVKAGSCAQSLVRDLDTVVASTEVKTSLEICKFVNFKAKASSTLTSTGGHLTIPQVTRIAPKPGQRKRTKNCKTVTAPSKKVLNKSVKKTRANK
jgi:hypothetical protein